MAFIVLRVAFLSLAFIQVGYADTLTLRDNAEINGTVRYVDDAFLITARYAGGPEKWTFDRREVLSVEFNKRDFNSGPPPKDISIFVGRAGATKDASREDTDSKKAERKEQPVRDGKSNSGHSVFASDTYNPTDDVIWLRNKTRVAGRLVRIDDRQLVFQSASKDKSLESAQVVRILVAPN